MFLIISADSVSRPARPRRSTMQA
uniref:Uncharacterized protein n=1 Tax=Arundo donax TaxID=35708 RepID=A0A0A9FE44_ARUDO